VGGKGNHKTSKMILSFSIRLDRKKDIPENFWRKGRKKKRRLNIYPDESWGGGAMVMILQKDLLERFADTGKRKKEKYGRKR